MEEELKKLQFNFRRISDAHQSLQQTHQIYLDYTTALKAEIPLRSAINRLLQCTKTLTMTLCDVQRQRDYFMGLHL